MTKLAKTYVLAAACAAVALAAPQVASAQESKKEGGGKTEVSAGGSIGLGGASGSASADAEGTAPKPEKEKGEKPEADHAEGGEGEEGGEAKFKFGVDFVQGFGKLTTVQSNLPGTLATVPDASLASSKISTQSFLFSGGYELTKNIGIGLRLPFTHGTWTPDGGSSRGNSAVGNLELEGEYELHLNERMKLYFGLGIALPTAQGDETPTQEDIDKDRNAVLQNQNGYDRFAINHAAAASRGFLDNALFESKRLGIIPQVGLDYTVSHVLIDPFVKMENLISTSGSPEHKYVGELVLGSFFGYEVAKQLDVGARVWTNILFAGGSGAVGVVEPQLRFHFGNITPIVAGIIPFAGDDLTSPQFGGIRVAVLARF